MFSGNFMPIRFKCTDFIQTPSVAAKNKIEFLGDTAGKTISLQFGGYTVDMVAKTNPDDSGYEFYPAYPIYDSAFGYSTNLITPYFKANYFLNEFFEFSTYERAITLTAKTKAAGLDFTPNGDATYAVTNVNEGKDEVLKENYAVYFELYLQNKGDENFSKIYGAYLPLVFGADGLAQIDVHERLETALLNDVYKDGVEANIMSDISVNPCPLSRRNYYFKFAESYGGQIKKVTVSSTYTVILGALSYPAQYLINQLTWFSPNTTKSTDRFMWQGAKEILTRFDTPQFRYFYNTRATSTNVSAKINFYFTDGTAAYKSLTAFTLNADQKYMFNFRFDVLHYNLIATDDTIRAKKVSRYSIWLENDTETISETLSFVVDRSYQAQVRYFLYLSSLGTLDTLSAVGVGKNAFDLEHQESDIIRQASGGAADGDTIIFDVKLSHKFTVACGWENTKEDFIRKRDFFASPKKYRYVNGYLLPIKITSKTIEETVDGRTINAQTLEYEYLFNEKAFTQYDAEEPSPNNLDY